MKYNWITLTYEMLRDKYYALRNAIDTLKLFGLSKEEAESFIGIQLR